MKKRNWRKHSSAFKKQVVLSTLRQDKTITEVCQEFELVESQVYQWKTQALEFIEDAFKRGKKQKNLEENKEEIDRLHRIIGKLTVERDFLENVWSRYQKRKNVA